jgi:transposase
MSQLRKFLLKLFKLKKVVKITDVEFKDRGKILNIYVKPYKNGCECPKCDRRCKIVGFAKEKRFWKDLPVHGIKVNFVYLPKEVECPTHGRIQENIPWADNYSRETFRFDHTLLKLCQETTQKWASHVLKIPKSTLSDILHRIVTRERSDHKLRNLKLMGVDEISYKKGHKYATIVYDMERSKVVWVGEGKGSETLEKFFKEKLSPYQREQIEVATCDMSQSYISVIEEYAVNAKVVLDRFHIVKALNEAMDEVRKEQWRQVPKSKKKVFKGMRWALFRHSSRQTSKDKTIVKNLNKINNRIYRAWVLKDEFEHFWDYSYRGSAEKFLKTWITKALKSRLESMRKFANTLRGHKDRILTFIETGLTNARAEGINRVIKIIKNRASGFRGLDPFADLIYLKIGDLDIPNQISSIFHLL